MSIDSIKGKAVITGASTGIGAIYADRLAKRGYDLILVARNRDRLTTLASRISTETGRSVEVLPADLNNRAELSTIENRLRKDHQITLLVNNAGLGAVAPLLDSDIEKLDELVSLNVSVLTRLTYAAVPGFVARGAGALINIASIVAVAPEMLNGVYGASKAYVLALSQSLHHELSTKGIRVQAVLPGATATPFWDAAGMPVANLPPEMVMSAEDMVDAALAGFDQGELVTIPSMADAADWTAFEAARLALAPNLSLTLPAARYHVFDRAAA